MLDPVDVGAGLGEGDPAPLAEPAVDVVLARVVRRERGPLVAVLVEQVPQVPGAVAHVELRLVEVVEAEARAAGADRDPLGGRGLELHQPDRARVRARARAELALLVDDRREERRVEAVVPRMAADDLLVRERVAEPLVPGRLRAVHVREACGGGAHDPEEREDPRHDSRSSTSPAKRSSPSREPSFTYAKSARRTFSSSGRRRCSRASTTSVRAARTSGGAVITTTLSKRRSPPVS